MLTSLRRNAGLIVELTRRDVAVRYKGSALGLLWSFLNPLLMLAVYTLFFSTIFRARWPGTEDSRFQFAVVLFAGMIVFLFFSECLNRAPSLILGNVNYVKKISFPLEILPWVSLLGALFHLAVSLVVWLVFHLIIFGSLKWTTLLLPLTLIPLCLLTVGVLLFVSAAAVYLRDIGYTTNVITSILLFASPVFFPVESLPEAARPYLVLNPLTVPIEQTRGLLIWGRLPDWPALGIYTLVSIAVAAAGYLWFQKVRRGFADVL
jgi:lipopolysaccharide transport system permease protein